MKILAIESSCDETAASVVENGNNVLSNVIYSQILSHNPYGGVVPELAARKHLEKIDWVCNQALKEAETSQEELGAIAVTALPGLIPALLVGTNFASGLANQLNIPLIPINHLLGHIYGGFIERQDLLSDASKWPILSLLVSGGHTQLLLLERNGKCTLVGQTLDDAAGEAYDKAAKIMNLSYPGGPIIDKLAKEGNPKAINFPRPLSKKDDNRFNFSFSGLKTALFYYLKEHELNNTEDVCASYQQAIVDSLCNKTIDAALFYNCKTVVLCGGVACNSHLRSQLSTQGKEHNLDIVLTPAKYCTDNAAMIASIAYFYHKNNYTQHVSAKSKVDCFSSVPFI